MYFAYTYISYDEKKSTTHPFEQVALLGEVVRVEAPVVRLGPQQAAPSGGGLGISLRALGNHLELGEALPLAPPAAAALHAHLVLGVHPKDRRHHSERVGIEKEEKETNHTRGGGGERENRGVHKSSGLLKH